MATLDSTPLDLANFHKKSVPEKFFWPNISEGLVPRDFLQAA